LCSDYRNPYNILNVEPEGKIPRRKWEGSNKADLDGMCVCVCVLSRWSSNPLYSLTLMLKAVRSFETSVTVYRSTRRNIQEDLNFSHVAYIQMEAFVYSKFFPEYFYFFGGGGGGG
jgi:hypothetical protein